MESVYDRVKELCKKKHVTVSEMERDLGLTRGAAYKWTQSKPNAETIMKLSKYFSADPSYITDGEEEFKYKYYRAKKTGEMVQMYFERPECRMLFDATKDMQPEDVEKVVAMIKVFKGED